MMHVPFTPNHWRWGTDMNVLTHARFEEPSRRIAETEANGHELLDLFALYSEMEKALNRSMPDEAQEKLHGVLSDITNAIVDAPIGCVRDIATKFRFLAHIVDDDAGMMYCEPRVMQRAIDDLLAFRRIDDGGDCARFYQNFAVGQWRAVADRGRTG